MFKRALAHQSNATPLRSSDRRKLVKDVMARYQFVAPTGAGEDSDHDNAREEQTRELGKVILPEAVRSAAIQTSGGVEGTLYISPETGDALWMTFGRGSKELIPTRKSLAVNLLALPLPHPPLPIIKLHSPLPPPLFTGAPLFIGAVRDLALPHRLPDVPEGGIVAFVTAPAGDRSDDVHYVGVGRLVSAGGMRGAWERRMRVMRGEGEEEEGRFCEILCIVGDHLWEAGSKPALSTFTLPPPVKPLAPPPPSETGQVATASASTSNTETDIPIDRLSLADEAKPLGDSSESDAPASSSVAALTSSEISTLLTMALHQALSTLDPSAFPMPASTLYSAHVLPARPAYIPRAQREDVVVGRSEWKKVSKWLKEVAKEGLVKVKESKGEVTVVSCDPTHVAVDGHKAHVTIAEEEAKAAKRAAREEAAADGLVDAQGKAKGKSREIPIEDLWKPSGVGVPFWEACGVDKTELQPAASLKSTLEAYYVKHALSDPKNQRFVVLDEILAGASKARGMERLSKDDVLGRLKQGVAWSVSVGGVVKKGHMTPVTLSVKTRQGRKVVTLISGLEGFGVNVDEFAEEMRRVCAGSASTQPLQGASPKLNLQEVLVQGNQVKLVTEALLTRGVPRRYIKEGEGDKKKK